MRELIQKNDNHNTIRWKLLTSASALALAAYVSAATVADAADADRPPIWIELGGGFEQIVTKQEAFSPPFASMTGISGPILQGGVHIANVQNPVDFSFDEDGKILFEPDGTDWVFSAGVRYGHSGGHKDIHQQTNPRAWHLPQFGLPTVVKQVAEFSDTVADKSETNEILDFQAGKDVGLGMFGTRGTSVLSAGVRIAQFRSALQAKLGLDPDTGGYYYTYVAPYASPHVGVPGQNPHVFLGAVNTKRSFTGIGPELSWSATANIGGNEHDGELTLDWGLNAALLFGRQKASAHHQQTARTGPAAAINPIHGVVTLYQKSTTPPPRSRTVTVPNVGGFAGLSFRYADAKISLGYRADWFFGAMDGGLDARKNESVGFHGPFASVSFGIGD